MNIRSTFLAAAGLLSIAAPAAVHADPWDNGYGGYYDQGRHEGDHWRDDNGWRDREWRENSRRRRDHWGSGYGWGYRPRCWIENRGHYTWDGEYVYRQVRICR